ncbi:hypothetical protein RR46_00786 [Papilio xuthus]|uniref:Uncharacterized protein n=1 Tax=Papilio xuthus TaxID=66420 RepID=A0A0N1ID89_PAPXU|nr:hypothetical protein RR46_00786 [Papilio xuthus]
MADLNLVAVLEFLRAKFPDAFKALTAETEVRAGPSTTDPISDASLSSGSDLEEMELDSPLSPENPEDIGGLFTEVRNKKKRKKRSSPAPSSESSSSSPVPPKAPRPHSPLESGSANSDFFCNLQVLRSNPVMY